MGRRTKSQTQKKGGRITQEYYQEKIWDANNPSDNVRGVGNTKREARADAERKWRDKKRDE